jgi:hypothetical protein
LYHRGVEQTITNYKFLYKVNDVRQGFSKVEDAGEGLVRIRGPNQKKRQEIFGQEMAYVERGKGVE